jgi:transcriptional regulator with XRE-family HTH domain
MVDRGVQNGINNPMPRLNSSASARSISNKRYGLPHSPFQKLIDGARLEKDFSLRRLADAIGTSHSSLNIWLTNANGYPHPKAFKQRHLTALARVLGLPASRIQGALDQSRRLYTTSENPMPPTVVDSFRSLIEILENDRRTLIRRKTVLNMAKRLYAGSSTPRPRK